MAVPEFFLVGAPKSGTTALYACLRSHPDLFLPDCKEPHYFGSDLEGRWFVRDAATYHALFEPASASADRPARCAGEASVFYLYARRAAAEIAYAAPHARIIVLLREPVALMHALHAQLHYNGNEDIADFGAALAAEKRRKRSREAPNDNYPPELLWYREVVDFAPQLQRFFHHFGRDRVHVALHEDWRRDPERVYRDVLRFLGVRTDLLTDFALRNRSKGVRSRRLHRLLMWPHPTVRRAVRRVIPVAARQAAIRRVQRWNTSRGGAEPLSPALRAALTAEMRPRVAALEALLGRDLSSWSADEQELDHER